MVTFDSGHGNSRPDLGKQALFAPGRGSVPVLVRDAGRSPRRLVVTRQAEHEASAVDARTHEAERRIPRVEPSRLTRFSHIALREGCGCDNPESRHARD